MGSSDSPIVVIASGFGGVAVCDAILRLLPKEDTVLLADHAYAPYARRRSAVVIDRLRRLACDVVAERRPKLVVLASAPGCADALEPIRAGVVSGPPEAGGGGPGRVDADALEPIRAGLAPLPVIGIDGIVPQAAARSASGRTALMTGAGCLGGGQLG